MVKFSHRLRELLKEYNMTYNKLAKELNFSGSAQIYYWLQGMNNPNLENLIKIADYYNCSLDYLIGRIDFDERPIKSTKPLPRFRDRLDEILKSKHVSKYRMIKDGVINFGNIGQWYTLNGSPNFDSLIKLGNYFNVTIDYLVGRE